MSEKGIAIDERIDRAAQHAIRARIFYDVWFFYEGSETRPNILNTMDSYSEFFRFDSHAHLVALVVYLAGLFEKRRDTINLRQIAIDLKKSQLITSAVFSQVNMLLDDADPVVKKAAILRRNAAIAHRSAKTSYNDVFRMAAITAEQLRELTEVALKIANLLLMARGQREQYFNDLSRDHVAAMLSTLAAKSS